jgi:hypothetical protein
MSIDTEKIMRWNEDGMFQKVIDAIEAVERLARA